MMSLEDLEVKWYVLIKKTAMFILPEFIIQKLFHFFIGKKRMLKLKEKIIIYLEKGGSEAIIIDDNERLSIIENLKNISLVFPYTELVLPYGFVRKYNPKEINVFFDPESRMRYAIYAGEKIFFPKNFSVKEIRECVNDCLIYQDSESPHRYHDDGFYVEEGDVIADMGAAEGFWALLNARKAKKIYLFECDKKWSAALQKTFEPWKEKVEIIPKFISDTNTNDTTTLDEFVRKSGEINFIKADIEGAEIQLLKGGVNTLSKQNNIKLLLCTYHKKNDAVELEQILKSYGFMTGFSKGFMIMIWDRYLSPPYLRRGLIRAKKA